MLTWHDDEAALLAALRFHQDAMDEADAWIESMAFLDGYCSVCRQRSVFQVNTGVMLGTHPSLREGLLCQGCGLVNRNRLMFDAVVSTPRGQGGALVMEATSALFERLAREIPGLQGSEYFGPDRAAGEMVEFRGARVAHRSITDLGLPDGSMALVVHNDVLEHVADTAQALRECRRVLCEGGASIFTMPFFPYRDSTLVRGRLLADGSLQHIEPPEYHGDILRAEGIYTFYHFGMDFPAMVRAAGFRRVQVGMDFDVYRGYTTNNYRYGRDGLVPPVVFRAWA